MEVSIKANNVGWVIIPKEGVDEISVRDYHAVAGMLGRIVKSVNRHGFKIKPL